MTAKRILLVLGLVTVIGTVISCSSGPSQPTMGSPAYYWQGAREVFKAGDYAKTLQNLDNVLATDNDLVARALPWALVLRSGMTQGYMDAADNYDLGAHVSHDPSSFRRQVSANRDAASQHALQFAEDFSKIDKLKGDNIALDFAYPKGNAAPVTQFTRIAGGISLTAAEAETAQQRSLERGVVLATCRAVGAPNDPAKTEDLFKSGPANVPRATFLTAMADSLYRFSQIYARDKLDEPRKMEALLDRAQTALAGLPETKEIKDLKSDIAAAAKKMNK